MKKLIILSSFVLVITFFASSVSAVSDNHDRYVNQEVLFITLTDLVNNVAANQSDDMRQVKGPEWWEDVIYGVRGPEWWEDVIYGVRSPILGQYPTGNLIQAKTKAIAIDIPSARVMPGDNIRGVMPGDNIKYIEDGR